MHVLEHFFQMRSDIFDFLGLRKDLKKVILRKEVETSENCALLLDVVLQSTLYSVKFFIALLESVE